MRILFRITNDGVVSVDKPFIVECGCAGASAAISNIYRKMKLPNGIFPRVKLSGNRLAKKYLEDNGYYKTTPALRSKNYALLIDPRTKKAIDFYMKDKAKLSEEISNVIRPKSE